jgi:hypothetical protein
MSLHFNNRCFTARTLPKMLDSRFGFSRQHRNVYSPAVEAPIAPFHSSKSVADTQSTVRRDAIWQSCPVWGKYGAGHVYSASGRSFRTTVQNPCAAADRTLCCPAAPCRSGRINENDGSITGGLDHFFCNQGMILLSVPTIFWDTVV